jgi:hypothetical protein
MGWRDLISGDARSALAWSEKGVELAQSRGDWAMRAVMMGSLGASHWHLDDAPRAEQVLRDGIKLAFEVNDKFGVANGLEVLAWITEARHQPRQAAVLMAAAAEISRASGAPLATFVLGEFHAECERHIREQLSSDEFQTAWNEGTALNMADVARRFP